MGRRPDPSALRQFAGALRPGAVLHLYQHVAGKDKYHVLIAAGERSVGFIINSQPSEFVKKQPDLLKRQVPMPHETHPFMPHASVISCHDTVLLPSREDLIEGLLSQRVNHVGHVAEALRPQIAAAAAGSSLIAARDGDLIVAAFAV